MVVASTDPIRSAKIRAIDLPIVDLLAERTEVSKFLVKACEEFGFFKVINHGVPKDIITQMEDECFEFFSKPVSEKQRAGPPNPYGYGSKNIGFNGDVGEVEYLLLDINPLSIFQGSNTISNDPSKFSNALSGYVEAVRGLACEILDLMAEGLWVLDTSVFSRFIRDVDSDSLLRLNYYAPLKDRDTSPSSFHHLQHQHHPLPPLCYHHHHPHNNKIGFGEHSDPQILTILRSNDVGGLQISVDDGEWVPVSPDPTAFCVNVGDVLQAMTNGRFLSVRHRAMVNSNKCRMSMAYFGAPPLHASITCPPELIAPTRPQRYRPFTWAEYKKAMYSLRLGDSRLNLFRLHSDNESRE
ncbi:unnamed protein product [Ilex paraguariensis]|uniref:gibberellin 2beta-dioxygenase n=1 Tax=Ilex paraguariensis TaxID=185542 RepID=A0ABC8QVB8_9AQUA